MGSYGLNKEIDVCPFDLQLATTAWNNIQTELIFQNILHFKNYG